tara:strand:- start:203 stop:1606 length:1404 start_codon:yes stop_codon:yes gene_type:complete
MLLLRNNYFYLILLLLTSCSQINSGEEEKLLSYSGTPFINAKPTVSVAKNFNNNIPDCIAVLPIQLSKNVELNIQNVDIKKLIRHTVYAHLSPLQYKDIELSKIDYYLSKNSNIDKLSSAIQCNNYLTGKVTRFTQRDLKIYSNISIAIELRLFNNDLNEELWSSKQRIDSHGGTIPLSPIGIAFGLADAAKNLEAQQHVRITDEIVRSLISTLPDNNNLEFVINIENSSKEMNNDKSIQNAIFLSKKEMSLSQSKTTSPEINNTNAYDNLFNNQKIINFEKRVLEDDLSLQEYNEFNQMQYDIMEYDAVLLRIDEMIINEIYDNKTYFLKGRIHLKRNEFDKAEKAFIKSAALNNSDSLSLNALGYIYSLNNKDYKAEAAYKMAINNDNSNTFAYLNLGILAMKSGNYNKSLEMLETAGVFALKQSKYDHYLIAKKNIHSLKKYNVEVSSILVALDDLEKLIKQER